MLNTVLLATAYCLLATAALAAFDPLTIGIGARALGMGGVNTAIADSGDVLFGNPAGLGEIDSVSLTSMSGNLLEDVHYTIFGGVYPLGGRSAVGLGYSGAFVSGIELRDYYGNFTRRANYGDSALLLAYGRKLTDTLSLGARLKYYLSDGTEIDSGDGRGWNADLGIFSQGLEFLSLGVVGQNLVSSSRLNYQNGESAVLPQRLRAGARLYLLGSGFRSVIYHPVECVLAVDTDFNLQAARALTARLGLEVSPNRFLTVRAGSNGENLTAGLSLMLAGLGFHYAYQPYSGFTGNTGHFFSLTIDERGWPPEGPEDVHLGCKEPGPVIKLPFVCPN